MTGEGARTKLTRAGHGVARSKPCGSQANVRNFPSSHGVLLLPEGGFQPLPYTGFGFRFFLHGQHCLLFFPAYLPDEGMKYIIDVVAVRSGRLKKGTAEFSG